MTDFSKYLVRLEVSRVSAGVHMDPYIGVSLSKLETFIIDSVRYLSVWKYNPTMSSKLIEITFGISRSLFYNKPKSYLKS